MDNHEIGVDGGVGLPVRLSVGDVGQYPAQRAITQLVGRVIRQPHAQLTGRESLDQCYVYCNNVEVGTVVQQVKNGLEAEGLTGMGDEVMNASGTPEAGEVRPWNDVLNFREKKSSCRWCSTRMARIGLSLITSVTSCRMWLVRYRTA